MKELSMLEILNKFPDDEVAEEWFTKARWPNGILCAHCESDRISKYGRHPEMPFRCKDCRKFFSVKTKSFMHGSNIGYQKWAIALYVMTAEVKGTSSVQLHKILGITQSNAWHMAHRIREAWALNAHYPFTSDVEVDETYVGGLEKNKHFDKRLGVGGGGGGKVPVVGAVDRKTNQISAYAVPYTDKATLHSFVHLHTSPDATIYTDANPAYIGMRRRHYSVNHKMGEYVRGNVHTNSIESYWALVKRAYKGTYHQFSWRHINRYLFEFSGRHNKKSLPIEEQMVEIVRNGDGRVLTYKKLTGK